MTRRALIAEAVALLSLATACDADLFGPSYRGDYDMHWVNGDRVPAIVFESSKLTSAYRIEITSGTLHLRRDHTFSMHLELRETGNGTVYRTTQGYTGSYGRSGRDLYLYYVDPLTNRERTLSGFVRSYYVEILLPGVVDGQILQCGFEK